MLMVVVPYWLVARPLLQQLGTHPNPSWVKPYRLWKVRVVCLQCPVGEVEPVGLN